jgi:hypothetical protein
MVQRFPVPEIARYYKVEYYDHAECSWDDLTTWFMSLDRIIEYAEGYAKVEPSMYFRVIWRADWEHNSGGGIAWLYEPYQEPKRGRWQEEGF